MLDTILNLGHIVGSSKNNLKFHAQIMRAPFGEPDVDFFQIPVYNGQFQFPRRDEIGAWEMFEATKLDNENLKSECYCWNFKTSDSDSHKRYVFGDISRRVIRSSTGVQETGNFKLLDKTGRPATNSFAKASGKDGNDKRKKSKSNEDSVAAWFEENCELIKNFRESFGSQITKIEDFLKHHEQCYIHFDFSGEHWHKVSNLRQLIDEKMLESLTCKSGERYALKKSFYKTLSGSESDTIGFSDECFYKSRSFSQKELTDLAFGSRFASRPAQRIGSIKIIILPRGEHLNSYEIEEFFDRVAPLKKEKGQPPTLPLIEEESVLRRANTDENDLPGVLQIDCIFARDGQQESDLIELVGLDRSFLARIHERIDKAKERSRSFYTLYAEASGRKSEKWFFIEKAFRELLLEHRYEGHLLKTLPKIYSATYAEDQLLLPSLIERVEYCIRNGAPGKKDKRNAKQYFHDLKHDWFFLLAVQQFTTQLDIPLKEIQFMNIENNPSYRIGYLLGKLGNGAGWKVASFEKAYVGLLSRRLTTIEDVISLRNKINEYLIHHDLSKRIDEYSLEVSQLVKNFAGALDRDLCVFGFQDGYFEPSLPKATPPAQLPSNNEDKQDV